MPLGASLPLTTDQITACSLAESHDAFAVPGVRPKAIVIVSGCFLRKWEFAEIFDLWIFGSLALLLSFPSFCPPRSPTRMWRLRWKISLYRIAHCGTGPRRARG